MLPRKQRRTEYPTITLSIEIKERELTAKVLLAKHLASEGFRVIMGSTEVVHAYLQSAQPTLIFHKSTFDKFSEHYKALGHKFIFMDEEGGITTPRSQIDDFCHRRYRTVSRANTDLVFFPSEAFMLSTEKVLGKTDIPFHVTGWPRIDLWESKYLSVYESQVSDLRSRYGEFFLFPTSFGSAALEGKTHEVYKNSSLATQRIALDREANLHMYLQLLLRICPVLPSGKKIVLRPHPSESVKIWKRITRSVPNLIVKRSGDITPWILASGGLIQHGSTTAVQAASYGIRSVTFGTQHQIGVTDSPSFEVCKSAHSDKEVVEFLEQSQKTSPELRRQAWNIIKRNMFVSDGETAVERITRILKENRLPPYSRKRTSMRLVAWASILVHGSRLKALFRTLLVTGGEPTVSEKIPGGITRKEIRALIEKLELAENRTKDYSVTRLAANLLEITSS